MSRAQITLFIVIGVVLLSMFGLLYFLSSDANPQKAGVESQKATFSVYNKAALQMYIQQCFDSALDQSVRQVALQGGYCGVPKALIYSAHPFAYYRINDSNSIPTIQQVEIEISDCARTPLFACLAGQEFSIDEATIKTLIGASVISTLHMPVVIDYQDTQVTLSEFSSTADLEVSGLYGASSSIIAAHDLDAIPVSKLNGIMTATGYQYELVTLEDHDVIYALSNPDSSNPLLWAFAVRYRG